MGFGFGRGGYCHGGYGYGGQHGAGYKCGGSHYGNGFALIVVLFILLIVIGAICFAY
ncbi:MAG TPA: YjcZ family sporulation protein [Bacillota bacterium]